MASGNDLYAALIGEAPSTKEKQAALADILRRRSGLAEVAQLTGDPMLAPFGQQQGRQVDQQAAQLQEQRGQQQQMQARQAQQQAQMQFQQQQEARQAAAQQEQLAVTRRGQDMTAASALANTRMREQELEAARANKPAAQPTEGERKAATLGVRLEGALRELDEVGAEASKPGMLERGFEAVGAEALANASRSTDRQRANNAQMDALDAALTLATGASYTKEQLANLRASYFPQLNDDPKTIAAKSARFKSIVDTAKIAAGRAAPTIDAALGGAAAPTKPKRVKVDAQGNVIGN